MFYLDRQGRSFWSWHFNLHFIAIIINHYPGVVPTSRPGLHAGALLQPRHIRRLFFDFWGAAELLLETSIRRNVCYPWIHQFWLLTDHFQLGKIIIIPFEFLSISIEKVDASLVTLRLSLLVDYQGAMVTVSRHGARQFRTHRRGAF